MSNKEPWDEDAEIENDAGVKSIQKTFDGKIVSKEPPEGESSLLPAMCRCLNVIIDKLDELTKTIVEGSEANIAILEMIKKGKLPGGSPAKSSGGPAHKPGNKPRSGGRRKKRTSGLEQAVTALSNNEFPEVGEDWFDDDVLNESVGFGKHKEKTWGGLIKTDEGLSYICWLISSSIEKDGDNPGDWYGGGGAQISLWMIHHRQNIWSK